MNRLWVKLTLAFVAVALAAVGVVAVLAARTTGAQFQEYVVASGARVQSAWTGALVGYYAANGSWSGVDDLLTQPGRGTGAGWGRGGQDTGLSFTIADATGHVIASQAGEVVGQRLPSNVLAQGAPLILNGQRIGTLLNVRSADAVVDLQGQTFLRQVRNSLVWAAALAVLLALTLGIVISQRVASPLVRLTHAATAIAGGQLQQQVLVSGGDEIGQLGEAFNQMAHSLVEAETLRRNMVADVAHELRTPLTVIQGNLQAMLEGVFPMDTEQVVTIYDETRLLTRLVDDLRDLALADASQLRIERLPVDLAGLAEAAVGNFAAAAGAAGIQLLCDAPERTEVLGDTDRLAQVLRNLLSNALHHTPPGGQVTVRVTHGAGVAQLAVADTGSGISAKDLPHIFDRFYRADKSRSRRGGGAGLGLAIVRQLVAAHGGRISVAGSIGVGTTFTTSLSLAPMPSEHIHDYAILHEKFAPSSQLIHSLEVK
jgi:two-component system, OmpR family, sensor kinase